MRNFFLFFFLLSSTFVFSQEEPVNFKAEIFRMDVGDEMKIDFNTQPLYLDVELTESYFKIDGKRHGKVKAGVKDDLMTYISSETAALFAINVSTLKGAFQFVNDDNLKITYLFKVVE